MTGRCDIGDALNDQLAGVGLPVEVLRPPSARGWIHVVAAAGAVIGGTALLGVAWTAADEPLAIWAALVYVTAIVGMFTVSATYHRVRWTSAAAQKWMKRVDHSAIFVFIAATYTPFALLAMPPQTGYEVLAIVWTGAAAGVLLKMLWPSSPRWVGVPLYLTLGYVAIFFAEVLLLGAGATAVALLVAGAVLYNAGAVCYGTRWPNPWPSTFGHHEVFHAFTAAAAVCHFAAIWLVIR
ncbi:hemolysin III family protein [Mycobacterium sp. PS03-16]|uniref:PAQR family membrane homeostasis protein TrhA n=1 Tax=Mycobacterium sp. PS03-16 TaxID=2559611 RepID=UPI001073C702|nr:hemolysin III family protein [Mycobacterium sp. PS03-16]TFV60092.1 hemolysin III family protein [Mycobacterium sp. PS03-16]